MIEINDKHTCCGCSACASVCPKKCITMKEDEEGFLYPETDKETCIECGRCEKVCPIRNPIQYECFPQKAYLVQHTNQKILKESTSGGGFTAIATWIIEQGGVVFGAAYNDKFEVIHRMTESIEGLSKFRNSKYAQSVVGDCFREVKRLLKDDRWVCFSGTPCQLEGLYSFLGRKSYDKLLLVDVVCHACPSPLVFRKYLEMQKEKIQAEFKNVLFRRKTYGYKYSTMSIITDNKNNDYHGGIDTDVMMRAFFSNISVRPSCYACPSKKRYRCTDLTIWDCFDVGKFSKSLDNDKGVTRILAHTNKGINILSSLTRDLIIEEIIPDKAVEGVKEMYHSVSFHPQREAFFADLNRLSPEACFKKYFPITLRHRVEKLVRLGCNKLGIYAIMKRVFKAIHGNKEIKR